MVRMTKPYQSQTQSPTPPSGGRIELICGCMFAGKTRELIRRLSSAEDTEGPVIAFKHALDDRSNVRALVSHDGRQFPATPVSTARGLLLAMTDANVIGIDEAQFFGGELVDACARMAADGRRVIVAGLDRTCFGEAFEATMALRRIASMRTQLHARCAQCGAIAEYTQRLRDDTSADAAHHADPALVGGPEAYEPRCARCFRPVSHPRSSFAPARADASGRP